MELREGNLIGIRVGGIMEGGKKNSERVENKEKKIVVGLTETGTRLLGVEGLFCLFKRGGGGQGGFEPPTPGFSVQCSTN